MPENLATMVGAVKRIKPNALFHDIQGWLNSRLRSIIDIRPYWADLGGHLILSIPAAYSTGTISVTTGSRVVTGVGTAWPVSDVVNTTVPASIERYGNTAIEPASMSGITEDSVLYLGDGGPNPEAVPVMALFSSTIIVKNAYPHNAGATLTQSSLVGRQFRVSSSFPIFTIKAVHSATELELDQPWGGLPQSGASYSIKKIYYSLGKDLRMLHAAVDHQYGWPISVRGNQKMLNWKDPQRTDASDGAGQSLVPFEPSENGAMLYELYPAPVAAKQIMVFISRDWPALQASGDQPPHFINPQVLVNGALADALLQKMGADDIYFNPQLSDRFERKWLQGVEEAKSGDSTRHEADFAMRYEALFPGGGAGWNFNHDYDLMVGNF